MRARTITSRRFRARVAAAPAALVLTLVGCARSPGPPPQPSPQTDLEASAEPSAEPIADTTATAPVPTTPQPPWVEAFGPAPLEDRLQLGDVVFLDGETWGGRIIRTLDDAIYTHCGIIAEIDGRRVFVHSSPITLDGSATVAADSLTDLIWSGAYPRALVLRPDADADTRRRIAETAASKVGVPYDGSFDLDDHSRIYCTELVLLAFERENLVLLEHPLRAAKFVPLVGERVLFPDALLDSPALLPAPEETRFLQDAADLRRGD